MRTKFLQRNTKKLLAASLAFWLSGLMFLFCCEMPKTQAAAMDSCPLAKMHHCDRQSSGETISPSASFETDNRILECCRFLPVIFDKARKIESNQNALEIAAIV